MDIRHGLELVVVCLVLCCKQSCGQIYNVALGKPVTMSSTLTYDYVTWSGGRIVDGNISTTAGVCYCCASTDSERNPWITIDLLQEYRVVKIVVKGRTDKNQFFTNLENLEVYIGDQDSMQLFSDSVQRGISTVTATGTESTSKITLKRRGEAEGFFHIAPPLYLVVCEVEIYADVRRVNIALGKPVTLSSLLTGYTQDNPSNAVDGNISANINECNCCVSTDNGRFPWLTVDLLQEYKVYIVMIRGRIDSQAKDSSRNLEGLEVFMGGNTSTVLFPYQHTGILNGDTNNVQANGSAWTRMITLKRPSSGSILEWYLSVCEIEVYVMDCKDGYYGNCNQTCGHCKMDVRCDKVTGQCGDGCQPGYRGERCDQECNNGTYGNCSLKCGQCASMLPCNHVTGQCQGGVCKQGYKGEKCNQSCNNGTYGSCKEKCGYCASGIPCDHVTGKCHAGCEPGYTGVRCNEGCGDGWYGLHCSESCGQCVLETLCHKVTGKCPQGCDPGYKGDKCDELCDHFKYGQSCNQICGSCADNETCHHINGSCLNGCAESFVESLCQSHGCDEDLEGHSCSTTTSKSSKHDDVIIAGVVGTTIGIVISAAVVGAVFLIRKMKINTRKPQTYEEPRWSRHEDDESQYSTIESPGLEGTENPTGRSYENIPKPSDGQT